MKIQNNQKRYIVAGGNLTALVDQQLDQKNNKLTQKLLLEVEQVGYVSYKEEIPKLTMMGNELSVNGTIAFASTLGDEGELLTSGLGNSRVLYSNQKNKTTIQLPISPQIIDNNIVLLKGIGYLIQKKSASFSSRKFRNQAKIYCKKLGLPAFGVIEYVKNQIYPIVYVKKTNSLVKETACGSGSIVFSKYSGYSEIIQPSGEKISVIIDQANNSITVSAKVKEINYQDQLIMNKQTLQTLKGFRDFFPEEKRQREYVEGKIIEVFNLFGFEPLETPTLEYAELLLGKYGDEADKLVYTFNDKGGRNIGLRYDQTVPTARILAQYQNNLPKFFRRYQIQNVFRADKPQAGRYREFCQCDLDIFGTKSTVADAEILACSYQSYKNIGFTQVKILINDRKTLISTIKPYATDQVNIFSIIQSIDKLDKKTEQEIIQELEKKGLPSTQAVKLLSKITEVAMSSNLQKIVNQAIAFGIPRESLVFSPTLARGLDYYTGLIFEIILPEYSGGSCGGGGRYDSLIEDLSNTSVPAVGVSFGFDRTVEAAVELGLVPSTSTCAQVLVSVFSEELLPESLKTLAQLRQEKVNAYVYPEFDSLGKQFKYANQQKIPWVIVIGENEVSSKTISLKNMISGEQRQLATQEALNIIRKN